MTNNGIDWLKLMHEWWPVLTFFAGYLVGEQLNRFYFKRSFKAMKRQRNWLASERDRLVAENERIIYYTNDLIRKHNLDRE